MTTQLLRLRLNEIEPSPTNPRKDFDSPAAREYLQELASTIKQHGVKQPILVRPPYCVGKRSAAEIEAARVAATAVLVGKYRIVFGECRFRSSEQAGVVDIPALVEELTDDDAAELQLIENLARRDISPFEEAESLAQMLQLKNEDGGPRYTHASLAIKLGRCSEDWVYKRLALLSLSATAREAMQAGILPAKTARLIATVLDPKAREDFTAKILKPELEEGPLSWRKARDLRDRDFAKLLSGAPFKLDDAELVPAAGACLACPKMSANCVRLLGEDAPPGGRSCLNPSCYRDKIAAVQQRQADLAAKEGKSVLPPEKASEIYPFYTPVGVMDVKSPYVRVSEKPADHLLKKEVANVPTWGKLVQEAESKTGAKVPRVMIADQSGAVFEHVETKLAMAAIEKAGEPIFREPDRGAGGGKASGGSSFDVDRKAEADRAKARWAVTVASLDAVWAALGKGWESSAVWDELFFIAMGHAGNAGLDLVVKWKGLTVGDGEAAAADAVEKWWHSLKDNERDGVIPVLLVAGAMKASGTEAEDFKNLARALKVDLPAVEKKALVDFKQASAPKLTPEQVREKARELRAAKHSPMDIAVALGVSLKQIDRVLVAIEKDEAAAAKANDPKVLAEWVRASAGGMSYAEIARSYKVPVAEVEGALSKEPEPGKRQAVVTLIAAGKDKAAIAKQLGVSLPMVHLIGKQMKAATAAAPKPAGKAKLSLADKEKKVRELRAQGKTIADIFMTTKYPMTKLKKLIPVIDAERKGAAAR